MIVLMGMGRVVVDIVCVSLRGIIRWVRKEESNGVM